MLHIDYILPTYDMSYLSYNSYNMTRSAGYQDIYISGERYMCAPAVSGLNSLKSVGSIFSIMPSLAQNNI